MLEELTPREIISQHKEDFTIIALELLTEGLSPENMRLYKDLTWQIQSIEGGLDCADLDVYAVYWVFGEGFLKCPLRMTQQSDEERSCVEVDCPRFNSCELTKGILDKYT